MTNPLLAEMFENSVIPRVEIALPTRGQFYPEGEVLSIGTNPDALPVKPLSVLDESTFNDPLMLISGHAIEKMIAKVCPDVIDAGLLCDLDIQAILIGARIASRGPKMSITHKCDKCKSETDMEIDLNNHILNYGPYTPEEFAEFTVVIEEFGQEVQLMPMRYSDTVSMTMAIIRSSNAISHLTDEDAESLTPEFIDQYRENFEKSVDTTLQALVASISYIKSKSGKVIQDRDVLGEWLHYLSVEQIATIRDRIKTINDAIQERSLLEYQCQSCGADQEIYLELDPQKLFTPAAATETQTKSSKPSKSTEQRTKKASKSSARLS